MQADRGQVTKKSFRSANNGLHAEDQTNSGLNKLLNDVTVPQVDIPTRWGGRRRHWPQMLHGEESSRRKPAPWERRAIKAHKTRLAISFVFIKMS